MAVGQRCQMTQVAELPQHYLLSWKNSLQQVTPRETSLTLSTRLRRKLNFAFELVLNEQPNSPFREVNDLLDIEWV